MKGFLLFLPSSQTKFTIQYTSLTNLRIPVLIIGGLQYFLLPATETAIQSQPSTSLKLLEGEKKILASTPQILGRKFNFVNLTCLRIICNSIARIIYFLA